ncbi:MAG: DNA-formamidopyrimidine glycosylase family protein, partial [Gemmatimonadales bacterium]
MPELPDIAVYLDCLAPRVLDQPIERFTVRNPFVLRSVNPTPAEIAGSRVEGLRRMGKRIVLVLERERFVVVHLMIAGRLRWLAADGKAPGKIVLAQFEFPRGVLVLTEAGNTRRASIHLVEGEAGLQSFERGGLEVLDVAADAFAARLVSENHTLKRALTDPRLFSGIGNAYSDEILHRARLSPLALTPKLAPAEVERLYLATRE